MTPSLGAPDLDEVVHAALSDVRRSLAIGGDFYPFGVATAADGSALEWFAAADPETGEEIWSLNALDILHQNARRFDPMARICICRPCPSRRPRDGANRSRESRRVRTADLGAFSSDSAMDHH